MSLPRFARDILLFEVPFPLRDSQWRCEVNSFLPQVRFQWQEEIVGIEGLYRGRVAEFVPIDTSNLGTTYSIFDLANIQTERGEGLVLKVVGDNGVQLVLKYGELWSLREFATCDVLQSEPAHHLSQKSAASHIPAHTRLKLLKVQESEDPDLPGYARKVLRGYFEQRLGIHTPQVTFVDLATANRTGIAFSIFEAQFQSPTVFRNVIRELLWFLPAHFRIVALGDDVPMACWTYL
jgi:hypothetical protein